MSYNISQWELVELVGLSIPASAFEDYELTWGRNNHVLVEMSEDWTGVKGTMNGERIDVESVKLWAGGSGSAYSTLIEALRQSTGTLVALIVWEDGDSIQMLESRDGAVTETPLDIAAMWKENRDLKAQLEALKGK